MNLSDLGALGQAPYTQRRIGRKWNYISNSDTGMLINHMAGLSDSMYKGWIAFTMPKRMSSQYEADLSPGKMKNIYTNTVILKRMSDKLKDDLELARSISAGGPKPKGYVTPREIRWVQTPTDDVQRLAEISRRFNRVIESIKDGMRTDFPSERLPSGEDWRERIEYIVSRLGVVGAGELVSSITVKMIQSGYTKARAGAKLLHDRFDELSSWIPGKTEMSVKMPSIYKGRAPGWSRNLATISHSISTVFAKAPWTEKDQEQINLEDEIISLVDELLSKMEGVPIVGIPKDGLLRIAGGFESLKMILMAIGRRRDLPRRLQYIQHLSLLALSKNHGGTYSGWEDEAVSRSINEMVGIHPLTIYNYVSRNLIPSYSWIVRLTGKRPKNDFSVKGILGDAASKVAESLSIMERDINSSLPNWNLIQQWIREVGPLSYQAKLDTPRTERRFVTTGQLSPEERRRYEERRRQASWSLATTPPTSPLSTGISVPILLPNWARSPRIPYAQKWAERVTRGYLQELNGMIMSWNAQGRTPHSSSMIIAQIDAFIERMRRVGSHTTVKELRVRIPTVVNMAIANRNWISKHLIPRQVVTPLPTIAPSDRIVTEPAPTPVSQAPPTIRRFYRPYDTVPEPRFVPTGGKKYARRRLRYRR